MEQKGPYQSLVIGDFAESQATRLYIIFYAAWTTKKSYLLLSSQCLGKDNNESIFNMICPLAIKAHAVLPVREFSDT